MVRQFPTDHENGLHLTTRGELGNLYHALDVFIGENLSTILDHFRIKMDSVQTSSYLKRYDSWWISLVSPIPWISKRFGQVSCFLFGKKTNWDVKLAVFGHLMFCHLAEVKNRSRNFCDAHFGSRSSARRQRRLTVARSRQSVKGFKGGRNSVEVFWLHSVGKLQGLLSWKRQDGLKLGALQMAWSFWKF